MKYSTKNEAHSAGRKMADNNNQPPSKKGKGTPATPPVRPVSSSKSLKSHCLERGISLGRVVRSNRQYVSPSTPSPSNVPHVGKVFWNNFSPPPGYVNDVEDSFSQDFSQQPDDGTSPAHMLTKSTDRSQPARPRRPTFDPNFNVDEFFPIETGNSNRSMEDKEKEEVTEDANDETDAFVDDELSDSMIYSVSQKIEDDYCRALGGPTKNANATVVQKKEAAGTVHRNFAPSPDNVLFDNAIDNNLCSTPLNPAANEGKTAHSSSRQSSVRRRLDLISTNSIGFDDMEDDDMDSILSLMEIP